ncbi:MAG: histidine--tRNA ligase [Treponema sp.]|nr:histidine--tRNA ligase [Treponema sp.]
MTAIIEPRVLKGFRDFLPSSEITRIKLIEKIEASFRSFGFVPIDTPALEYAEILLGKGGGETEKQIYRFTDNGGRDVALRFDLTVPFARFTALHQNEIAFPFKRYHIGKVWRGENTQRGRYREFTQCDFDIIGSDSTAADFEILLLIRNTLLGLGADVRIHLNHRGLFNLFLKRLNLTEKSQEILQTVDKKNKVVQEETFNSLASLAGEDNAKKILHFTGGNSGEETFEQCLQRITELTGGASPESERLSMLRRYMTDSGCADIFVLDPSITRGLDYYTGVVFETFLTKLPDIGSICSGGRYDNLAGLYSKSKISGVGSSIGLDRMIAALENLGALPSSAVYAKAAICCNRQEHFGLYQTLALKFREADIPCEVFLEETDKQVKQFVLAEKKGIAALIIPGENPLTDPITIRDIGKRQNTEGLSFTQACKVIGEIR